MPSNQHSEANTAVVLEGRKKGQKGQLYMADPSLMYRPGCIVAVPKHACRIHDEGAGPYAYY